MKRFVSVLLIVAPLLSPAFAVDDEGRKSIGKGGESMSKMREIRKGHSMTLAELAFRSEVQEAWLSKAERGWKKFSETAQGKIAAVLGVDRKEIFDDAGRAKN